MATMLVSVSPQTDLDASATAEIPFADYAALLQALLPGASQIGFFDLNGRARWTSDQSDSPELSIRISKFLLQANACIQDAFAEKTKQGSHHVFAVRGPDDVVRGAVAFALIRGRYVRHARRLKPDVVEAMVSPMLRILGRALEPVSPQSPASQPQRRESRERHERSKRDPFVGAAARSMSLSVVMRRAVSTAINACDCAFAAMVTEDRQHTVVVRGLDEHIPQSDMRHIVDALRDSIRAIATVNDDGSVTAAPNGAADFQLIAYPAYGSDRRSGAVLVLFRRRNDTPFDETHRACVRDIAARAPARVLDELPAFPYSRAASSPAVDLAPQFLSTTHSKAQHAASSPKARLRAALRLNQFELHAQSIVPLSAASDMQRCELLLRLQDETSLQLPHTFFEVAERDGLLPDIDRWVIGRVLQIVRGQTQLIRDGRWELAINVSAASLQRATFGDFIETQLFRNEVPPQALVFEFSEADVLGHLSNFEQLAPRLAALGCRVAIDNCRQGLDLFLSIGRLPVHRVKIDAALTHHVASDPRAAHAVRELVEVARDVDIETVGEHIEDEMTCTALRELGVDFAQGFRISQPQPFTELFC